MTRGGINMEQGPTLDALLDALLDRLAVKVAKLLAENGAASTPTPRLLSVPQAAAYMDRTPEALRHLLAAGELPSVRTDRRVHVDRVDIDKWIEEHKH